MTITRENMSDMLSEKSGYWKKDIRYLLHCLDEVVFDELSSVDDGEEVVIQVVSGIKVKTTVIPERERVDPRDQKPIIVKSTIKPACKFSQDYRNKLQEVYDNKKNG